MFILGDIQRSSRASNIYIGILIRMITGVVLEPQRSVEDFFLYISRKPNLFYFEGLVNVVLSQANWYKKYASDKPEKGQSWNHSIKQKCYLCTFLTHAIRKHMFIDIVITTLSILDSLVLFENICIDLRRYKKILKSIHIRAQQCILNSLTRTLKSFSFIYRKARNAVYIVVVKYVETITFFQLFEKKDLINWENNKAGLYML